MSIGTGLAGQIAYGEESVWGTAVTPSRALPLISEKIDTKIDRLESKGIIAGRTVQDSIAWAPGRKAYAGPIQHELYDHALTFILKHTFGTYAVTGSGPYVHTMSPGDITGKGLTVQVGRPDVTGTVQPFTHAGGKIRKLEIAAKEGEIATVGLDMLFKSMTTATALVAATYASTLVPVTFEGASLSVGGSSLPVKEITWSMDNGIDDRRFVGSALTAEPLQTKLRQLMVSFTPELSGLTEFNRYANGTMAALVFTLAAGSNSYAFTCNVRYDDVSPALSGPKVVEAPVKAKCVGTTDAAACTLVVTNSDATA